MNILMAKKTPVVRVSATITPELLAQLDAIVAKTEHKNRSFEISEIIRRRLMEEEAMSGDTEVIGTITLLFDHHESKIQKQLTNIQHDYQGQIISTLHVHVDHDNCLEVLVVRGKGAAVESLSRKLIGTKGMKIGKLTISATNNILHT